MKTSILLASVFTTFLISISMISFVSAHPHPDQNFINNHSHEPKTEYFPINGMIGLEKTTLTFHSPRDNTLPWGFVEGKIANHVSGYPVIIQFFQDGEARHFAQTEVLGDGTYEYKFRVFSIDAGNKIMIFDGDYTVLVFKVVYLKSQV